MKNQIPNKNIKSFATLSGMLRSFLAAHPLCWRYVSAAMKFLIFTVGIVLYVASCLYIAKLNVVVRRKILGKLVFEYVAWLLFIIIYIPYSIFFPAWFSESLALWQRTPNTTAVMILFGVTVMVFGVYKGGRIDAT